MNTGEIFPAFVSRKSFIELDGRERAQTLFDQDAYTELVGPFDRVESPWLPRQGIAPQADDGCIVIKGKIGGLPQSLSRSKEPFKEAASGKCRAPR